MNFADEHCGELLGAYFLGACSDEEAAFVSEHLARCTACARSW